MKKLRGYIFSRPFYGERVPQNIQNLVIRNYCEKNAFIYLLSIVEYCIEETFLNLNLAISQLKNCDGIVSYSLFQLPANEFMRKEIVLKTLKAKKEIHFALENMKILKLEDYYKISDILKNNPINKRNYNIFRNHVHDFTNTLHQNYIECYICKTRKINETNEIFRPHLICLHEMYINELRIKKEYISKSIIIKYVNKLEPKRLFYCLNKPARNKACVR